MSQRFGAPETYTPKHLAERIVNSKAALEGERKQVALAERHGQALPLLEEVVFARKRRETVTILRDRLYLADAYLRVRRLDEALGTVRQGLDLAHSFEQRGQESHALRLLAEVHAARGASDRAVQHFQEALALASELGMRPLAAHCHAGLAKLYRRTGEPQQAHEHLATGTMMYREMGMTYWLEKAEAEIREPG